MCISLLAIKSENPFRECAKKKSCKAKVYAPVFLWIRFTFSRGAMRRLEEEVEGKVGKKVSN